jgi:predicted ATPase/DNA-binding SARP family transcriptional activator
MHSPRDPGDPRAPEPVIRVLGAIEVDRATIGSPRLRRLVAALAVHANTVVSADRLTDLLWGAEQPESPEAALHTLVSRLRSRLTSAGLADRLLTRSPGYVLRLDPDDLDTTRFGTLLGQATAAIAADPATAADLLDAALLLWRGDAYAEFVDDEFAAAEITRLHEARVAALELRARAALELGRPSGAVIPAEQAVSLAPLRDGPRMQLMLALARGGRPSDALAVYRDFRSLLDVELGLEPSAAVTELHGRILRQDPTLSGGQTAGPASSSRPPRPAGNLPATLPALIGREDELANLTSRLEKHRLVTIVGPGGVGKTRLALAAGMRATAGGRLAQGVWLIELAPLRAGESPADQLSTALSISPSGGLSTIDRLVEFLGTQRCLLILDNCEHLIAPVARLVQRLLDHCPGVTVLATSQMPLNLPLERNHPLAPLAADAPDSPAVRLFLERAARVAPDFPPPGSDLGVITDLCRRLDGVPLAIELAAGRMRFMTPEEVLDRLTDRFRLLRSTDRLAADRHRTLRSVVEWSYGLLDDHERQLFERLSVFRGAFGWAEAAAVAGSPEHDVIEPLESLVEHSIVQARTEPGSETSFMLLETLREFGAEQLQLRGEAHVTRRAHARTMLAVVHAGQSAVAGPSPGPWVRTVAARFDDLRAAHAWALDSDLDLALELVVGLADWLEFEVSAELVGWAERTAHRALAGDLTDPAQRALTVRAMAMTAAGIRFGGDLLRALELARQACDLVTDPTDPVLRYPVYVQCEISLYLGRLTDCRALADRAQRLAEDTGDMLRVWWCVMNRALALAYDGRVAEATAIAERVVAEAVLPGVIRAWAWYTLGEVLMTTEPDRASTLLLQAVREARRISDRFLTGVALLSVASLRARQGDPAAVPLFREVIEHWHRLGNWTQRWTSFRTIADLLARLGDSESAAVLVGAALAESRPAQVYGPDAVRLADLQSELRTELGTDLDGLLLAGASMTDDEVFRLVRGSLARLDTAGADATSADAVGTDWVPERPR